jgi:predicted nucleotidyltransferase
LYINRGVQAMYGLKQNELKQITSILDGFLEVEEAVIFGSRAMGNYRRSSDVDLALKGELVTQDVAAKVSIELNGIPGKLFRFDVVCYPELDNPILREHIGRVGQVLYKKRYAGFEPDPDRDYIR